MVGLSQSSVPGADSQADDLQRDLGAALADPVARALGVERVLIDGLTRLSGGASRETWSFEAHHDRAATAQPADRLILQRTRPGPSMTGPTMAVEDKLMAAAAATGVPVPVVLVDSTALPPSIGSGRITRHVAGETLGHRIIRDQRYADARSALTAQCGRALAAIHSIDPAAVPGLEPVEPLARLRAGLDLVDEHRPVFELALRWLARNRPPPSPPSVVHGDFRLGNLIVDESGLRAVLDWELAHLGDPLEDLGWLCVRSWRFGGPSEVAGVGNLDELVSAYGEARGSTVDLDAVRWWITVGTLTWGLICAVQARRHLDGHVRSVELATIGRRVSETEYDLLDLVGIPVTSPAVAGAPGPDARRGPAQPAAAMHGRPTAAELVSAVRGHLSHRSGDDAGGPNPFHDKVAANALAIVERELDLGPAMAAAHADRLAHIGFGDEADLAAAIRDAPDDAGPATSPELLAAVRAAVVDRVRVANPRWLLPPDVDPPDVDPAPAEPNPTAGQPLKDQVPPSR